MQHAQSKGHMTSGASSCPSASDFGMMIDERFRGTSLRKSKLGPHKSLKMMWCAHEAIKDLTKARANRGLISASVSQDGQGTGLGVRACFVTSGPSSLMSLTSCNSNALCAVTSCHHTFMLLCPRMQRPSSNIFCDGLSERRVWWLPEPCQGHPASNPKVLHFQAVSAKGMDRPIAKTGDQVVA